MKKQSFVFYETFYEDLQELDDETKLKFYEAIIAYGLYGKEPERLTKLETALWKTFKFAIDTAKARREKNIENGKKGGRPPLESKKYEVEYKVTEMLPLETTKQTNNIGKTLPLEMVSSPIDSSNFVINPIEIIEKENRKKPNYNLNANVNANADEMSYSHNEITNSYDIKKDISNEHQYKTKFEISNEHYIYSNDLEKNKPKNSQAKNNNKKIFKKPSIEEIQTYCNTRKNSIKPQVFYDFYESVGWMIGSRSMCDWKATIRVWEYREKQKKKVWENQKKDKVVKGMDYSEEAIERFLGMPLDLHNERVLSGCRS